MLKCYHNWINYKTHIVYIENMSQQNIVLSSIGAPLKIQMPVALQCCQMGPVPDLFVQRSPKSVGYLQKNPNFL